MKRKLPKRGFVISRSRVNYDNMVKVEKELRQPYRMVNALEYGRMMYVPVEDMFHGHRSGYAGWRTFMECPVCGNMHEVSPYGLTCLSCHDRDGRYWHWRLLPTKESVEKRVESMIKRKKKLDEEREAMARKRAEIAEREKALLEKLEAKRAADAARKD